MDTTLISIQLVGAIAQAVLIKKAKQKKKKKRPRPTSAVLEWTMVDMMSGFYSKTDIKLDQLVHKVGFDQCECLCSKVYKILDDMHDLTMDDKLKVSSAICDTKELEIFYKRKVTRLAVSWLI